MPIFFSENASVAHFDAADPNMSLGSLLCIAFAAASPCTVTDASCAKLPVLDSSIMGVPLAAVSASIACRIGSDVISFNALLSIDRVCGGALCRGKKLILSAIDDLVETSCCLGCC